MIDPNRISQIDPLRSVYLGGWAAAVCVNPNGEESLWLLSPSPNPQEDTGCACRTCAPHEQLSPNTTPPHTGPREAAGGTR